MRRSQQFSDSCRPSAWKAIRRRAKEAGMTISRFVVACALEDEDDMHLSSLKPSSATSLLVRRLAAKGHRVSVVDDCAAWCAERVGSGEALYEADIVEDDRSAAFAETRVIRGDGRTTLYDGVVAANPPLATSRDSTHRRFPVVALRRA